jgi:RimJ/RimL family protein N-acetyltransferase
MSAETLETARLKLRPAIAADAPRIATLINDPDVARMSTRIPHPYALQDAESFLARCEAGDEKVFAIEHGDDGLVGVIGFHDTGPEHFLGQARDSSLDARRDRKTGATFARRALGPEVGYWLGRPYWGKGLATEAAQAALVWASKSWGRRCVVSSHFADNPASGAVLIKSGFLYTGEVDKAFSVARGEVVDARMMVWLA